MQQRSFCAAVGALAVMAASLLAVGVAGPARAQDLGEPDAARIAAARALVDAIGGKSQALSTVDQLRKALIANIQATIPGKAVGFAAYAEKVMAEDSPQVTKYLGDVESLAVNFYARRFTTAEIEAITAFQKSEAGRKFLSQTPELGSQIAARTMLFQREVVGEVEKGAAGEDAKPQ